MIRVGNGWIPRYGRLGCCVPGSGLASAVASASEVGVFLFLLLVQPSSQVCGICAVYGCSSPYFSAAWS